MHDQADQLRQLVRQTVHVDGGLAPGGPIVAVSGGQIGAGVTTIACQLARQLARLGKQVVLIDANLQRPAIAQNLACAFNYTLADVLTGARRAVEVLAPTDDEGVRLLAGCPPRSMPPLDRAAFERFAAEVAALSRQVDVVLLEAGHGMNAWIDRLWQLAGQVLLVATPDPKSLLDSYAAVKLSQFERLDGKVRLLVNRAHDPFESPPLAQRFEETCQRFLSITSKEAASLPAFTRGDCDEAFQRAVRLLAADLTCDFRVVALRLLRPKQLAACETPERADSTDLTPRR